MRVPRHLLSDVDKRQHQHDHHHHLRRLEGLRNVGGRSQRPCAHSPHFHSSPRRPCPLSLSFSSGGIPSLLLPGVTAGVCSARELVAPARAKSGLEALEEGVNALAEKLKKTRCAFVAYAYALVPVVCQHIPRGGAKQALVVVVVVVVGGGGGIVASAAVPDYCCLLAAASSSWFASIVWVCLEAMGGIWDPGVECL